MNIKNLRIFNDPKLGMRICAMSLAGIMAFTGLTGCSSNTDNTVDSSYNQEFREETKKVFDIGEHIISVEVGNPNDETVQYEYHEGYKCIGLSASAYGKYANNFGGACALYVNEYQVECYATGKDKNNIPTYNEFGTPLNYEKTENNSTSETMDFGIGQHIISVPITTDPTSGNIQYPSYDGYEAVDIAITAYGKYANNFGGGAIMYVNTEPVRCKVTYYDDNNKGHYLTFGTPIELENNKTKTKN